MLVQTALDSYFFLEDPMPTPEELARLDNDFTYHPPKPGQPDIYQELRGQAKQLAESFYDKCPPSRERSLALTNLEQAVMWANAAIARSE